MWYKVSCLHSRSLCDGPCVQGPYVKGSTCGLAADPLPQGRGGWGQHYGVDLMHPACPSSFCLPTTLGPFWMRLTPSSQPQSSASRLVHTPCILPVVTVLTSVYPQVHHLGALLDEDDTVTVATPVKCTTHVRTTHVPTCRSTTSGTWWITVPTPCILPVLTSLLG